MMLRSSVIAVLVLIAGIGFAVEARNQNYRSLNGVRLAGSTGSKGRLELSSKDSWFAVGSGKAAWSAVCDSALDDNTAQIMCELLNYKHGRKYFSPDVAYVRNPLTDHPIGDIVCEPESDVGNRRLLRGDALTTSVHQVALASDGTVTDAHGSQAQRRALFSPLRGRLNTPTKAPYSCSFFVGSCGPIGPMAGIECSHSPMRPAPPPPPQPPSPPPAPPAVSNYIRLVGGYADPTDQPVEPNLCNATTAGGLDCELLSRVEVQVDAPGAPGSKIWAPLCTPTGWELAQRVGYIACQQEFNWPLPFDGGIELISSYVPDESFILPKSPVVAAGNFDPASYKGWVTVTGDVEDAKTIQSLTYKVTTTRCARGAMLAVFCATMGYH